MTFIDAAAQSRTFTRARTDLVDGFRRRELWLHLGWQDIKQRYRRSVLGPFWITIATGTTAVAMGGLYSKLFHLDLSVHLPYVTLGLIIWNLINAAILEGADDQIKGRQNQEQQGKDEEGRHTEPGRSVPTANGFRLGRSGRKRLRGVCHLNSTNSSRVCGTWPLCFSISSRLAS